MDDPKTITVSRDALRADLLDMELRLTKQLVTKTDHAQLVSRVDALQANERSRAALLDGMLPQLVKEHNTLRDEHDAFNRGEFTEAQTLTLDKRIAAAIRSAFDTRWVWKERRLTVLSFGVAAASLLASAVIAYYTFKYHAPIK